MVKKNLIITEQQFQDLIKNLMSSIFGDKKFDFNFDFFGKKTDLSNATDKEFYQELLKKVDAPVTDENLKFMYAWRQSEGKAGKFNPFNTTQKMPGATNFNSVGVKNYTSKQDGLEATVKTLKNGRYNCILDGLKNDIGAKKISTKCLSDLKTWGTGDLVAKVVSSYESGSKPKPQSLA